jgi:hypothetical protein
MAGMYFWEWVLQGISNGVYGGGRSAVVEDVWH